MFTVGLLCVSDTASLDPSSDRVLPLLQELLSASSDTTYTVAHSKIVRDEPVDIKRAAREWIDEGVQLILTSGGTGFGTRDNTPEVIASLIDKPAPGIVTAMLLHSLQITPLAALSRPVAGIAFSPRSDAPGVGSLIVTLPGSPKGAKENLECLLRILPHALELASGANGRETKVHRQFPQGGDEVGGTVEQNNSHQPPSDGHSCSHHAPRPRTLVSQDPSVSIASRQRHSPWPLISVEQALSLIFENTPLVPVQTIPVGQHLIGHVLADDVFSPRNIPNRPSTNIDGYAVRSTDVPGIYRVVTTYPTSPLPPGSIYRINTGAPLPPGFDACIMVEDTEIVSRDPDNGEEVEVRLLAQVEKGENVRMDGSDVKEGEKVLDKGDVVSQVGGELATLAFVGKRSVPARRRPIVAVLSTGNELVDLQSTSHLNSSPSSFSSIVDSNRPALISILSHLHYEVIDLGICPDTMEATKRLLVKGKEEADVIVTTGGTSMGVSDLLKPCIEKELKGTVHFGRVAMKPGKPTTFATLPAHPFAPSQDPKLVFALPGNPASALVTFYLFVLPALRKMEGRRKREWQLPRVPVTLTSDMKLDARSEYHRVVVKPTKTGLEAISTGGQRSSRTVSLAGANGLVELPALNASSTEGEGGVKKKGEIVQCVLIGDIMQ